MLRGEVTVNGKRVTELGTKADPERDHIKVGGKLITALRAQEKRYILINKLRGYLSSASDPKQRPLVAHLLPASAHRGLHPVGRRGAVLGLSGGVDSALALCIAVDALGPAEVEAVLMPSRYTAAMSVEDARAQADALGIAHRIIPIEPAVVALNACLSEVFAGRAADTTEENIQARCRGVILMGSDHRQQERDGGRLRHPLR